ncbi:MULTISPECIES: hypothetical protein [Bacillaceae]|uniref:DUF8042 domain-containing protein n=1 Tax=Evansella alkalicola TaxID=745819 RepID=A0ABS6JUV5_9BACI|nr:MULTISPECIES: hypothetical protein [Bacillaceae]MBU9722283.1 hypothetical protein [Bacillus alkalicola]
MEKYVEVMKKSQELVDTMVEGLEHIQRLLSEGHEAQTVYLFENVVLAYTTIEKSLEPIQAEIKNEELQSVTKNLAHVLELVVDSYEAKDYGKVQEVIQFTLTPQVINWKAVFESAFKPYIVS